MSRRSLFKNTGKGLLVLAAALAGFDQGSRLPELLNPQPPELVFGPDQHKLLKKESATSKTAVVFFGGATVQDPSQFGEFGTFKLPFNEVDFPVGYMKYANYGLDPKKTAEELRRLKTEHGIENVIGIFHSAGFQFVAEAFDMVGEDIKLVHGVLDCTPLDSSTTDYSMLGKLTKIIDPTYDGGGILPAVINYNNYGNSFRGGAAGPDLAFDQAVALADGRYLTSLYVPRIQRDGTTFSYVSVKDSPRDPVIDPDASFIGLQDVLGVPIVRYKLEGNQGHANASVNPQEYQKTSLEIAVEQRSRLALAA